MGFVQNHSDNVWVWVWIPLNGLFAGRCFSGSAVCYIRIWMLLQTIWLQKMGISTHNRHHTRPFRLRQNDNKWKHDLYEDGEDPQVSNPRVGVNDLRLKLQKKGLQQKHQRGKSSIVGGRQDLREMLSGSMHAQPANIDLPKAKPVTEVARPARKSAPVEVPMPETKKVVTSAPSKKKSQQKGE